MKTYVIECVLADCYERGKVVHREYTTDALRAEACMKLHCIAYIDVGPVLKVNVYEDQQPSIDGYTSLIDECIRRRVRCVVKLP